MNSHFVLGLSCTCGSSVVPLSLAVPLIRSSSTSCTLLHFLSSSSSAQTCIWGHWEYLQVYFPDPHSRASFVPKALYQGVCLVHVPVFESKAKIHVQGFVIIQQSGNSAFLLSIIDEIFQCRTLQRYTEALYCEPLFVQEQILITVYTNIWVTVWIVLNQYLQLKKSRLHISSMVQ